MPEKSHFLATAKQAEFSPSRMDEMITSICSRVNDVIEQVQDELPDHFPQRISAPIFAGMRRQQQQLLAG